MRPFTNDHFADFCLKMAERKQPYWYGTCGYNCSAGLLERKAKQYPSHYGSSRMSRYRADISAKKVCFDCVGLMKGYAWTNGGEGLIEAIGTGAKITSKYASNNCPDTSANGMFSLAKKKGLPWGTIKTIPEVRGIGVRYDGHVGVYVGDGMVVEWRGFNYGGVITRLKNRAWTHWMYLPFIDYGEGIEDAEEKKPEPVQKDVALGSRLLKKGSKGADVEALQEALNELGFESGEVDGDFGSQTYAAVKRMQKAAGIEIDGKYGVQSHAALMEMLTGENGEIESEAPAAEKKLRVTGGTVNIRAGAGTQYKILGIVRKGVELTYTARAENGWFAVDFDEGTAWISDKYAEAVN